MFYWEEEIAYAKNKYRVFHIRSLSAWNREQALRNQGGKYSKKKAVKGWFWEHQTLKNFKLSSSTDTQQRKVGAIKNSSTKNILHSSKNRKENLPYSITKQTLPWYKNQRHHQNKATVQNGCTMVTFGAFCNSKAMHLLETMWSL